LLKQTNHRKIEKKRTVECANKLNKIVGNIV